MASSSEERSSSSRASKRASKSKSRVSSSRASLNSKRESQSKTKRQSSQNKSARLSSRTSPQDEPFGITNTKDVPGIVADLRKTFNSDHTRPKSWRLGQLNALKKMLKEQAHVFQEAAKKDLNKSNFEMSIIDIMASVSEAIFAIRHLDGWMADTKRPSGAAIQPAKSVIKQDPLGVVLVIGAWNYNLNLSLQPLIGAIAAGNCAVLKPGDFTPKLSEAIASMLTKYMDPSAIRCVAGDHTVSTAVLAERFDMIFFTGSTRVGKIVALAAAKNLTPVVLELGGKSPCIVDKNTNVETAARRIMVTAKLNAGQTCVRPDYILIHDDVADEFIAECKKSLIEFYGKDPKKSEWFGRVVNDAAFNRITGMLEKDSEYIVHGGKSDASERYIEPTLLDFGTDMESFNKAALMQDEIFGPVTPIVRYTGLANQVVPFIRARPKPLALYIFSTKPKVYDYVLTHVSSGGAVVNDCMTQIMSEEIPFGGVGESGMGSYHGDASFSAFSHAKSVVIKQISSTDPAARFPPYSEEMQTTTRKILDIIVGWPQIGEVVSWFQHTQNQVMLAMALVIFILLVAK